MKAKKLKCVGLDISVSSTGIAVIEGDRLTQNTVRMTTIKGGAVKPDIYGRMIRVWGEVLEFVGEGIALACVEEPIIKSRSIRSSRRLLELNTAICSRLYEGGIPFLVPVSQQLKQMATGYGRSDKEEVMQALNEEFGVLTVSDDESDAVALALMALTAVKMRTGMKWIKVGNAKMRELRFGIVKRVIGGKNRNFLW